MKDTIAAGSYVLSALRAVINQEESFCYEQRTDWKQVFDLALAHKVENIVAYALLPYKNQLPSEVWNRFEQCLYVSAMQDTRQDAELKCLLQEFEKNQIEYMVLKGYVLKGLYPAPDMRTMGDIDILVKPEKADEVKAVMAQQNYCITYENIREFNCVKKPMIHMEIHLDLISAQYKNYHNYYKDGWKRARKTGACSYEMKDEDYYIYHMVHLMKHYRGTGTGIRSFLDVYVFLQKKGNRLNWNYINQELDKIGLRCFAGHVADLAQLWFGTGERTELLSAMEAYVLESGVYGSEENARRADAVQSISKGKGRTYLRMVFPSMHVMSSMYPALRKRKVLLPYFWVVRLFQKAFAGKTKRNDALHPGAEADEKALETSRHFHEIGL